jgi:thymidylate kinase
MGNWVMDPGECLVALIDLFDELNRHGIKYCHWKSTAHLDRSLEGLTDLDLLVDREHGGRFRGILHQHDIKPLASPAGRRFPALEDYLGLDKATGRQFHLHVHYQLVLGEQFVKNYRLPIEKVLLENTKMYAGLVKIPAPEVEIVVLAIRALLKYRDRDALKDMLSIRSAGIPASIRDELEALSGQTDEEAVRQLLVSQIDLVSPGILLEFLATAADSPRRGHVFYRLRRDLRRDLAPYQRQSRWWARRTYFGVVLRQWLRGRHRRAPKKVPVAGGLAVAVVGADGAGKSTLVAELQRWLSWKMEVRRYHLGSQERSPSCRLAHLGYRVALSSHRRWAQLVGEQCASTRLLDRLQRLFHELYHLSKAWDRYRRYLAGRRQASQGAIVLYERYPLERLQHVMAKRPMDGPRIAAAAGAHAGSLTSALSRIERNLYRRILLPDHLFILHVSPHVSQQRKPDHDRHAIEDRSRALRQMDKRGLSATEIDADQPLEQVLLQVKTVLWDLI